MTAWEDRWKAKKAKARERKIQKRLASATWTYVPQTQIEEEPREPFDPSPNPASWFQFCVERKQAFEDRGDPITAMFYWSMRYLDECEIGSDKDPCTDIGFQDFSDYWDYKVDWYQQRHAAL